VTDLERRIRAVVADVLRAIARERGRDDIPVEAAMAAERVAFAVARLFAAQATSRIATDGKAT